MTGRTFAVALAVLLVGTSALWGAATGADFDLKIVPQTTELNAPAGGTVDLTVQLTTRVDNTQGWSFGVLLETEGDATGSITNVKIAEDVLTVKGGQPADFSTTSYYAAGDLANKVADCEPECSGIEAVAVTQGVVIDFMQKVDLPITDALDLVDLSVQAAGSEGSKVTLSFTDQVGSPPVQTVVVHSGASITPDVLAGAEITFKAPPPCAPPAPFTIEIGGASGNTDEQVGAPIKLNFNADGSQEGQEVQGWSYGICLVDASKLDVVDATVDGTDTATVKDGAPADFDTVTVFPGEGATHGVVIDFRAKVTIPAQNDWTDLLVTYKILMTEDDDTTYVVPCNEKLGSPPVANVMVIGGASIQASAFEGTDPTAAEGGCCDPSICNKPGKFTKLAKPPLPYFEPGNVNGDGRLDIADGIYLLSYLFRNGPEPPCLAAADFNNDGAIDQTDAIAIIYWRLQPNLPDRPEEGWPGPALGFGCAQYETELPCEVQCTP